MKTHLGVVILLALLSSRAAGETPEQLYEAAFGAETKAVLVTRATDDDLTLAAKLLAQAREATGPAYRALLCGKAARVACIASEGLILIEESIKLLAEVAPADRAAGEECLGGACDALCRRFTEGDTGLKANTLLLRAALVVGDGQAGRGLYEVAARTFAGASRLASAQNCPLRHLLDEKAGLAKARGEVEKRLTRFRDRLVASSKDTQAARILGLTHLTDLDDPTGARGYLEKAGTDPEMLPLLDLAVKAPGELADEDCQKLGNWYADLAAKSGPLGKFKCLARASACCRRRLELLNVLDPKYEETRRAMERLTADTAQAQGALCDGWINLMPTIDPVLDALPNKLWKVTEEGLSKPFGSQALIMIPYQAPVEYDFEVSFTCSTQQQPVGAICPINGRPFAVLVGDDNNTMCRIEHFIGHSGDQKKTERQLKLAENRRYVLCVQVRRNSITALLDGVQILKHWTDGSDLNTSARWVIPNAKALGFGAYRDAAVFHSAYVREVTGNGKFVPHPEKK